MKNIFRYQTYREFACLIFQPIRKTTNIKKIYFKFVILIFCLHRILQMQARHFTELQENMPQRYLKELLVSTIVTKEIMTNISKSFSEVAHRLRDLDLQCFYWFPGRRKPNEKRVVKICG